MADGTSSFRRRVEATEVEAPDEARLARTATVGHDVAGPDLVDPAGVEVGGEDPVGLDRYAAGPEADLAGDVLGRNGFTSPLGDDLLGTRGPTSPDGSPVGGLGGAGGTGRDLFGGMPGRDEGGDTPSFLRGNGDDTRSFGVGVGPVTYTGKDGVDAGIRIGQEPSGDTEIGVDGGRVNLGGFGEITWGDAYKDSFPDAPQDDAGGSGTGDGDPSGGDASGEGGVCEDTTGSGDGGEGDDGTTITTGEDDTGPVNEVPPLPRLVTTGQFGGGDPGSGDGGRSIWATGTPIVEDGGHTIYPQEEPVDFVLPDLGPTRTDMLGNPGNPDEAGFDAGRAGAGITGGDDTFEP